MLDRRPCSDVEGGSHAPITSTRSKEIPADVRYFRKVNLFRIVCSRWVDMAGTVSCRLTESHLTRRLFSQILGRIERLAWNVT